MVDIEPCTLQIVEDNGTFLPQRFQRLCNDPLAIPAKLQIADPALDLLDTVDAVRSG